MTMWSSIALTLLGVAGQAQSAPCSLPGSIIAGSPDANACDKAIADAGNASERAKLLVRRAYLRNEDKNAIGALTDLDKAVAADPSNRRARSERAYTRNELGDYRGALDDLDAQAKLGVDTVELYRERAFSRAKLGDFTGAVADRDRVMTLTPDDAAALLARASTLPWLGRFSDALVDLGKAQTIAEVAGDADLKNDVSLARAKIARLSQGARPDPGKACLAAQDSADFAQPGLIATCTAAFLAAPSNATKAEMLTVRSTAWLSAQDEEAATLDRQVAVALDPDNANWHANLGFSYINVAHSWAGEREFDRSLAINGKSWAALAGRALARRNLGKTSEAFADAKRSFEIQPNEIALTVLGDLAHDRKDEASAKLYWMGAYRLGAHGDDMIARLKSIGVTDPEHEAASSKR
jgi:tetratricopeptide (TPR) repeat protein